MSTVTITGAGGQLGRACSSVFGARGWDVTALGHGDLDVTDPAAVHAAIDGLRPDVVLHLAAWTAVDACEGDPDRAATANHHAVAHVSAACRSAGSHLCSVSTDYVFDGTSSSPYTEDDDTNPQSVYGATKLGGEVAAGPGAAIVRTSWLAGEHGHNLVATALRLAADPETPLAFVDDQRGCPTVCEDLAPLLERLAAERRSGLFHATNSGDATWFELVRHVLAEAGHDPDRVRPITTGELNLAAPRPAYSVLDNAALRAGGIAPLAPWPDAVGRLVAKLQER